MKVKRKQNAKYLKNPRIRKIPKNEYGWNFETKQTKMRYGKKSKLLDNYKQTCQPPCDCRSLTRPWRKWGQKRPQGGKWRKNATRKIKKNKSS